MIFVRRANPKTVISSGRSAPRDIPSGPKQFDSYRPTRTQLSDLSGSHSRGRNRRCVPALKQPPFQRRVLRSHQK